MNLHLPETGVPDRVSITGALPANERTTYAELDGPGCIQHIWVVLTRPERMPMSSRKAIIRIYFDEEPVALCRSAGGRLLRRDARAGLVSDRLALSVGQGLDRL